MITPIIVIIIPRIIKNPEIIRGKTNKCNYRSSFIHNKLKIKSNINS